MARVTEQEVKEINRETALTVDEVTPFLRLASNIVDAQLADTGQSAVVLGDIELLCAAALIAHSDRQVTEEKHGDSSAKYGGQLGTGWLFTSYGQMAVAMDQSGKLAAMSHVKGAASLEVLELVDTD